TTRASPRCNEAVCTTTPRSTSRRSRRSDTRCDPRRGPVQTVAVTTSSNPLVGHLFDGRYRVLSHLADGGMATVLLATDTRLDREVALKVMREDLAADETFVSRFRREARSAARLSQPNVVQVLDQGPVDGRLFLAIAYVSCTRPSDRIGYAGTYTRRTSDGIYRSVLNTEEQTFSEV